MKKIKISPATASNYLKLFAKKGLLKEKKERGFNIYSANLENEFYLDCKIFYSIRKIKESGLIEALNKFYFKPTIVLFGSAAQGLDVKTSDIDLLVISEKKDDFTEMQRFEKKLNRNLQLFIVKNIKELKNSHLINNILNGFVLQGEIKWI